MTTSPRSHACPASALLVLTLGLGTAAAQPTSTQLTSAQAEQLFRDGKKLMGEGRTAEACTAFDGSYRKSPLVSTLLNLADCREKNRELASAWGYFLDAERASRSDPAQAALNQTAHDRAARLEPQLSYLIVNVPDDSRVEGLIVTRNGAPVDPAEWNRASPVDGGTYVIEGKAPGHEPWSATVTVDADHDRQSVDVPRFKPMAEASPGAGAGEGPPADGAPSGWTGKRKVALGVAGVGVAAGVGALLLELSARAIYDDSKAEPDNTKQKALYDQANQRRLFAQLAGGVAVVAVGTAVVLWITGKPSASGERAAGLRPIVTHDRVGLAFLGHF